ncbi:MerR family transcriptional regulator [Streptomyces sp. Rer75]|uniref:MerR family transcriptional regulator n=1 Tax=Streptomyces sp. Rer75 TaxID=2750011 RepID=UPI00211E0296|nr:MerR family transcriptional regulator [Streptomyces sp. Rer75]
MGTLRISQLAERCGVRPSTLRFYETAGLLPAGRTASGYRLYDEEAVERLAFISSAKMLGLALEDIRELLDVRDEGVCAAVWARMLPMVAGRIADADRRAAELAAFSAHLAGVNEQLAGSGPGGFLRSPLRLHQPEPGTGPRHGGAVACPSVRPGSGTCPGRGIVAGGTGLHPGRR